VLRVAADKLAGAVSAHTKPSAAIAPKILFTLTSLRRSTITRAPASVEADTSPGAFGDGRWSRLRYRINAEHHVGVTEDVSRPARLRGDALCGRTAPAVATVDAYRSTANAARSFDGGQLGNRLRRT